MKLVDTNTFLRYFDGSVTDKGRAAHELFMMVQNEDEHVALIDSVVHELCYILSSSNQNYNLSHEEIRDRLLPFFTLAGVTIVPSKELVIDALDIFAQGEKIDFTDALEIAYVRKALYDGIYSFDEKMDKIGGANRFDPRNIQPGG